MKKVVSLALIIFATTQAQSPIGLGLPTGLPVQSTTGPSSSMGGAGTGISDENFGLTLNPANMAIQNRSAFSGVVSLDYLQIKQGSSKSLLNDYSPKLLSLIIPAGLAGNFGFAIEKRGEAALRFQLKDQSGLGAIYTEIQRSGGSTAWQGGWGYKIGKGPSIGILYERIYSDITSSETRRSVIEVDSVNIESSISKNSVMESATNGIKMGVLMPIGKFSVGVAGEYSFYDDNGKYQTEYLKADTTERSDQKLFLHLPPSIRAGVGYHYSPEWLFAADIQATLWERFKSDIDLFRPLRRTYQISAGTRYIPSPDQLTAPYVETVHYRAGLRYNQLPVDGTQEYSLSLGAGLPISEDGGLIDIVFEAGRRTDSRYSGYSENLFSVQLGINGGRNWFQKKGPSY